MKLIITENQYNLIGIKRRFTPEELNSLVKEFNDSVDFFMTSNSKIKLFIPQLHGSLKRYTKEEIRKNIILKYASDFSVDVIMEKLMETNPNINPESEETNHLVSRLQSGLESYLISNSI